jgi:hypothetical protein
MGMYELMEGKEVNGRGVWQMAGAGGQERFMYYGSYKEWIIGGRASMEAGKNAGWLRVASAALTPDQVTEKWQVRSGRMSAGKGNAWVDAPKVRARMYSAEEKRTAAERLEQERWSTNGGWSTNRVWDDELDDLVYTHADGRKQTEKPGVHSPGKGLASMAAMAGE